MGNRKRIASIIIFLLMAGSFCYLFQARDTTKAVTDGTSSLKDIYLSLQNVTGRDYEKYLDNCRDSIYTGETVIYPKDGLGLSNYAVGSGKETVVTLKVAQTAAYVFGFDYRILGDNILPTGMSLMVNGEYPYDELKRLLVHDTWITGDIQYDRYGNECLSMPEKLKVWKKGYLHDTAYLYSSPMLLYLEEGINTLTFQMNEGELELGNLYLEPETGILADIAEEDTASGTDSALPAEPEPGKASKSRTETEPSKASESRTEPELRTKDDQLITIEAEDITWRNSPNIRAEAIFNTNVTPYDPKIKLLNTVSESSFRIGGNRIEYEFEVENSGYYNLAFDYIQSAKSGFSVYRNIYIDGRIPSASYKNAAFPYSRKFTRNSVEAPVYLEEGTHTISIEVSLDKVKDAIKILSVITEEINQLALDISKITGGNENKYRDFDLEPYGFDIRNKLLYWAELVEEVHRELSALNPEERNVGEISQLKVAAAGLRKLSEKPNDLPKKLKRFSYGTSSARQGLNTVIENLSVGQLGLDKIYLYQKDAGLPEGPGFFKKLVLDIQRLFASFSRQDYAPAYKKDNDTLEVWVARPRQYLEILQRMVDTDFTREYGINVNLSIVPDQQKLILANASGKAPDAAIGISSGYIYDLALRGALEDMRQYDNFKEVAGRFSPGMLLPGTCDDGLYGLPETFNFLVLFYRTDIMDSLGLSIPDNMDEVRKLLPQLERMGLSFNTHVANSPVKDFVMTAPFIYQAGGKIMESGKTQIDLETPEILKGLKVLTENFTIYDMDYEVLSFYQAFRDGRMPIGISDYNTFNLLTNAAPELTDAWDIAPYPGIVDEEGNVRRYFTGGAESCVVFDKEGGSEAGWKFMDWWTSAGVQTEFAYTLQGTLGNEYLWNSANLEAIEASPWGSKYKDIIVDQLSWSYGVPRVPGGYIIERELGNILIDVVVNNENLRSAVDDAQKKINRELQRKLEEFGYLDGDGNKIKELIVPDIQMIEEWLE